MKRPLPFWLAAVLPATIAGHALAYALSGRSMTDGRHAWIAPVLECSVAACTAVLLALLRRVFVEAGLLALQVRGTSLWSLWPRMAVVQTLLFGIVERAEGTPLNWPGFAVQIAVALLAAYFVCLFARFLRVCAKNVARILSYARRSGRAVFVRRRPVAPAHALATSLGPHRFQRPPPALTAAA